MQATKKRCKKCRRSKPVDEYYTTKNGSLEAQCKECRKKGFAINKPSLPHIMHEIDQRSQAEAKRATKDSALYDKRKAAYNRVAHRVHKETDGLAGWEGIQELPKPLADPVPIGMKRCTFCDQVLWHRSFRQNMNGKLLTQYTPCRNRIDRGRGKNKARDERRKAILVKAHKAKKSGAKK